MACQGIEALAKDPSIEVVFVLNPHNKRLAERVAGIPNIQRVEAPCATRRFQGLRNHFDRRGIHALEKQLQALAPDLVLCIQGEIEDSSQAMLAARRAGIECVSYIAIPHRMAEMGARLGTLRDRINQYLLNKPNRYIAISESMKALLVERGVTQPIAVVPNGISMPPEPCPPRQERQAVLGLLGRVEFKQKQQDFMVQAFCTFPKQFADCHLVIAGGGPDEEKLKQLVAECPRREEITLLPWQDDTEAFYASVDFLMLPSRFEGVPLAMLEALARGIPVIGSARDGMRDILPEAWTFETENADRLAHAFSNTRKSWQSEISSVQKRVETEMTLETFKHHFHHAVVQT
ncbi:MAG: hypothetical protein DRP64_19105 [Verrucomicrobia bacterium]|nr:MAG: hypothetical protein DRP64_19105 [Verrucomicrobiota bacterium]